MADSDSSKPHRRSLSASVRLCKSPQNVKQLFLLGPGAETAPEDLTMGFSEPRRQLWGPLVILADSPVFTVLHSPPTHDLPLYAGKEILVWVHGSKRKFSLNTVMASLRGSSQQNASGPWPWQCFSELISKSTGIYGCPSDAKYCAGPWAPENELAALILMEYPLQSANKYTPFLRYLHIVCTAVRAGIEWAQEKDQWGGPNPSPSWGWQPRETPGGWAFPKGGGENSNRAEGEGILRRRERPPGHRSWRERTGGYTITRRSESKAPLGIFPGRMKASQGYGSAASAVTGNHCLASGACTAR